MADIIGVPRTTINDWLTRHETYIESRVQGKRKVYTENAVNVLKEIDALRKTGISSFEIDEELAKRHPVHGVPADSAAKQDESAEQPAKQNSLAHMDSKPDEQHALVIRNQMTEMGDMIKTALMEMNRRIEEMEKMNRQYSKKANLWFTMSVFFILLVIISGVFASIKLQSYIRQKDTLAKNLAEKESAVAESSRKLAEQEKILAEKDKKVLDLEEFKKRSDDEKRMLIEELEKDRKVLQAKIDEAMANGNEKAAENLKLREQMAREKQEWLIAMEEAKKDSEKMIKLLEDLNSKSSSPAPEAPKPITPKPSDTRPATP